MKIAICAFLGLTGLFLSPRLDAAAIVYTFNGFGTGTIGSVQFTDAAFTLEVFANTNNVETIQFPDGRGGFVPLDTVDDDSSRITIAGIGNALFASPERIFCNRSLSTAGFGHGTDHPSNQFDQLDVTHPAFSSYDLRSAFGPINGGTVQEFFDNEQTTRGALSFSAVRDVTFTAVIPEPSASVLLMAAVAGGAAVRRRQFRRK